MCEGDCSIVGQGAAKNLQLAKLIVAGAGDLVNEQEETDLN